MSGRQIEVVEAGQNLVDERPGAEIRLQLIVEREVAARALSHSCTCAQTSSDRGQHAFASGRAARSLLDVEVAEVLPELQIIVEAVLKRVADRKLLELEAIGAGLADIAAVGNMAVRIGQERDLPRHILLIALVVDLLILRENREASCPSSDARSGSAQ